MGHIAYVEARLRCGMTVLLVLAATAGLAGCQATSILDRFNQPEAHASEASVEGASPAGTPIVPTPAPTIPPVTPHAPTATPTPTRSDPPAAPAPRATLGVPRGNGASASEMDAASKLFPIKKTSLPKGVRKPPPNRLIIPSIGVDTKVIELGIYYNEQGELVWETAPFAAGHHIGTPNPGEPGNSVISGHISSTREGAVFKRLPEIGVGDGVVVITNDRDYLYQVVEKKVVEPTQIDAMNSTAEETLTLITCVPDGVYTHRLIVTAKRI